MKQLNPQNLQFGDGFTALGTPNPYTSSAEIASLNDNFGYFNMNAGLFVNSKIHEKAVVYGGYSFNNIGRPVEQFSDRTVGNNKQGIAWRQVVHVGAEWGAGKRIVVIPGVLWQMQAKAHQF